MKSGSAATPSPASAAEHDGMSRAGPRAGRATPSAIAREPTKPALGTFSSGNAPDPIWLGAAPAARSRASPLRLG